MQAEDVICVLRGRRVILDADIAALYGVKLKAFNQAVSRNRDRFPDDFVFRLTAEEWASLRSHIVTLERGRGRHRKYLPFAFTEHGVAMLSSVLRSRRAFEVNVAIVRAFIRLREVLKDHATLGRKIEEIERRVGGHDHSIRRAFEEIRRLMPPEAAPTTKRVGF